MYCNFYFLIFLCSKEGVFFYFFDFSKFIVSLDGRNLFTLDVGSVVYCVPSELKIKLSWFFRFLLRLASSFQPDCVLYNTLKWYKWCHDFLNFIVVEIFIGKFSDR